MSSAASAERPVLRQFAECAWCRAPFRIKAPGQRFCQDECRYSAKEDARSASPAYRLSVRQRCADWAAKNRGVTKRNAWLQGAPISEPFLPGGFLDMHADKPLKWPLEHRNVRGLHGAITTLTGDHHETVPRFALVPWHSGICWGVYLAEDALLSQLAGTRHQARIYEQSIELRFGGRVRIKSPTIEKRGHRRLRIDTLTPAVVRNAEVSPANSSGPVILNTLCAWLPRRVGVAIGDDDARLTVVSSDTRIAHVELGGKFGRVSGWVGSVVVDCNAVTHWLLKVAEVVGFGGRVAFGFGRIKVSQEE